MNDCSDHTIRRLFLEHGLRCTRQRVVVYRALAGTNSHPTAEELHSLVCPDLGLSLATVYNVLEAFCRTGLCRKLPVCGCGARFDADLSDHPHVVTDDGRVMDVPADLGARLAAAIPSELLDEIGDRVGAPVRRIRVEVLCESTAATSNRPEPVDSQSR